MKLEVLISCMYQNDMSIIQRSNIQSDVLIINQCDKDDEKCFNFQNKKGELCKARIINTSSRGLSKSRNLAIKNASADICLLCDDDEILDNDYVETIINSFIIYPRYHILAFKLRHPFKIFSNKSYRIGYIRTGRIGSYQIAFKKCKEITSCYFNEKMGSGTGNGGGEENKFLMDCLHAGAKIRYVPSIIGEVKQDKSQWFHGFTKEYWINRGWTSKIIYGKLFGQIYLWYVILFRAKNISKENSRYKIFKWLYSGFFQDK